MNNSINDSQETAVKLSVSLKSLSPDERLLLSDIIDKEIATGVIPPDHLLQHASQISALMTAQSDELVRLKMLTPESADRLRGQYLPRFYTSKLRQSLKGIVTNPWQVAVQRATARPSGLRGIRGSNLQNRGMTQVITTTDVDKWVALGWSSQSTNAAAHTTTVWRDFTRPEREKMGELRDALYRVVVGYTTIQKDIALGTMFQSISQRSDLSSATNVGHEDWVQVPLTEIADTAGVRSYGALAGMFVSPDVFNHLTKHTAATGVVMQTYKRLYALWKSGLTAKNPVAHGNNVMGNTMMAHFAGVSLWDGHKYAGALLDFVTSPPMMDEARQAGLFAGSISQAELLSSMPAELKALAAKQDNVIVQSAEFAQNVLTFFLGRPLSAAYQFEDAFFSYLIYRDARKRGLSPDDSVSYAQKYIFTYDDLPPTAEKIRDYALPFFSWTYKAIPALIHTAAVYPHRFIFPGAVLHGVSALMYAMAAGSDDETISQVITDYVTNERRRVAADAIKAQDQAALPPYLRGISTVLGTPKAVRIGMDVVTSLPLFWDITRIAPGGTLFDTDNNAGGIDFPQALTPSHPLFTSLVAMLGNKDMFNGKEIVLGSDTGDEKTDKRLLWLWRAFAPAIAIGNAHSERVANAIASITGEPVTWYPRDATGIDKTGAVVTPGRVAARLVGIKIQPVDIDMATIIEDSQKKKLLMQISAEIRRIERLTQAGAVSDKNADTEIDAQRAKQRSLKQGLTVEGGPTVD